MSNGEKFCLFDFESAVELFGKKTTFGIRNEDNQKWVQKIMICNLYRKIHENEKEIKQLLDELQLIKIKCNLS